MAGLDTKNLIIVLDKRVENVNIPWAKREDIINKLNKGKKTDIIFLVSVRGVTIFRSCKNSRIPSKPMAKLGANAVLDKKARPDTDYLSNARKSSFFKLKKVFRSAGRSGSRVDVSLVILDKNQRDIGRSRADKRGWVTGLEITAVDVDNFRGTIMLLSWRLLAWLTWIK